MLIPYLSFSIDNAVAYTQYSCERALFAESERHVNHGLRRATMFQNVLREGKVAT
jgi:hypothetical protein